jgi:LuxR family transcriptional regulator, maltose regulon positive regulatory protein
MLGLVATPVLATKLFTPTRRPEAVARERLTARLDDVLAPGHRLGLVSAPPGFGKTTVLTEWIARPDGRRTTARVAWLALDEGDNDAPRFLAHLVAALERTGLDISAVDPSAASLDVVTTLVNDLASAEEDGLRVLVLDDYHVIASADIHEAVGFLVEHLPEQLRLVLATRADPPLPLPRLRARDQLTELRAADLRFTPEEAHAFLTGSMGLVVTPADAETLDARTEGWVAGLQLAALSLRGITDGAEVTRFIEDFAGSNRFVIDYLADEVLARQPEQTRDFLLRTAVLERLTGPLCDAVTSRDDGAATLETLERGNLFVVPLDADRTWYRYHHLFADVLLARLLAERPDEVPGLHRRACDWYAAQGSAPDAVRHALAAQDFTRAGFLIEQALPDVRRERQDSLLLSWAHALPEDVIRRSPVLSILTAFARLMSGDLDAAASWLDHAESTLAAGESDEELRAGWADTEDLRTAAGHIEMYRASLAQARGDVAGTVRHAQRAVDLAGREGHFVRAAGSAFLGLASWAGGDVHRALTAFGEGVRALHLAGNLVDELDATVVLADLWVAAGRPSRARRLYEDALARAVTTKPHPRATADLHVGLAQLDLELDDLAGAEAHLETARVLGERASITENRYRWFVVAAGLQAARSEYDAATRLLDQAAAAYRPGFYPDVRPIAATKARVQIAAGDLEAAAVWAEDRGVTVDDPADYLHEHELLTQARLLLARARVDGEPVTPVLALLDRLHDAAAENGRHGSLREIQVLRALAHQAAGEDQRALTDLERSFADAPEPEGNVRLYLDEGPPMRDLLGRSAAEGREHARRLVRSEVPIPAGPVEALVDPLSERELEVLRLLDSELSGPQIARHLYVSVNTLRTHTKHIFTKLDVTTRAAAVRRGREAGLL